MTRDELVRYWIESSEEDLRAMESLFTNGHYVWALFAGHLVIEKTLKAYYVKNAGVDCPRIHNLLKIAEGAGIELREEQRFFLDEVTAFNIRARYPDFKIAFIKPQPSNSRSRILRKSRSSGNGCCGR